MTHSYPPRSHLAAAAFIFGLAAIAVLILMLPLFAFGQDPAALPGDDLAALLGAVASAVKGGDWQGGILVGILALVWVVRKVLVRIPKVAEFVASDEGGAVLLVAAGLPTALLAAKAGGADLSWGLAGKALLVTLGAGGGWSVGRKLLRFVTPWVAKVPKVGPALASLLDVISGAKAKADIAAATAAEYKAQADLTAAQAAAALAQPPVK